MLAISALALAVEAAEALALSSPTVTLGLTAAVRPFERSALYDHRRSITCMPPFVVTKVSTWPARTRSPARSTRARPSAPQAPRFRRLLPDRGRQRRPQLARSLRDVRAGRRVQQGRREVDHRRELQHGDPERSEDHERQGRCSQQRRRRRRVAPRTRHQREGPAAPGPLLVRCPREPLTASATTRAGG